MLLQFARAVRGARTVNATVAVVTVDTVCNETTGCEACPAGFEGGDCHEDINECLNNDPCDDHANCSNTIGTFKCICDAGFTQYNDTVCQGNMCINYTL